MDELKPKLAFCANCQEEKEHTIGISPNGEVELTCSCGRFIKLPAHLDEAGVNEYLANHAAHNEGQVSVDKLLSKMGLDKQKEQPTV